MFGRGNSKKPARDLSDAPPEGTLAFLNVRGILEDKSLSRIMEESQPGESLVSAAVRLGITDRKAVQGALAKPLSWEELLQIQVDPELFKRCNQSELTLGGVCPLHTVGTKLFVLEHPKTDTKGARILRYELRCRAVRRFLTTEALFRRYMEVLGKGELPAPASEAAPNGGRFTGGGVARASASGHGAKGAESSRVANGNPESQAPPRIDPSVPVLDLGAGVNGPPAFKLLCAVLTKALAQGASDVHFEPQAESLRIRVRRDGLLADVTHIPDHMARPVANMIKVHSRLRVDVDFMPQDGRLSLISKGQEWGMRVSVFPSVQGESIVLRVLNRGTRISSLVERGMTGSMIAAFRALVEQPSGIVLVVGPTGSGKSSTLFSALSEINTADRKIITLEDPVEYTLADIVQSTVDVRRGHTFARGLRSILRHDPEVVLLGEMRDLESAQVAMEAALTGHLVLSTLHTNDAPRAITRLLDIGIDAYLIEEALLGVLSQRLTRTLCDACKTQRPPTALEARALGLSHGQALFEVGGCLACHQSGYVGRTGVFELLVVSPDVRRAIRERAPSDVIRKAAIDSGMKPIWSDGAAKVLEGHTTLDELQRVLGLHHDGLDFRSAEASEDLGAVAAGLTWCSDSKLTAEIQKVMSQVKASASGTLARSGSFFSGGASEDRPRDGASDGAFASPSLAGNLRADLRTRGGSVGAPSLQASPGGGAGSPAPRDEGLAVSSPSAPGALPELIPPPPPALSSSRARAPGQTVSAPRGHDLVGSAPLPGGVDAGPPPNDAQTLQLPPRQLSQPGWAELAEAADLRRVGRSADALRCLERLGTGSAELEPRILLEGAMCRERTRDAQGALEAYRHLAQLNAPPWSSIAAGVLAYSAQNDTAALAALDTAAEAGFNEAELFGWRGLVLLALGRHDEALAAARQAVQLEPADPTHPERLAEVLRGLGRLAEAEEAFASALHLGAAGPRPHTERARILVRLGRNADALQEYDAALRLTPSDPAAHCGRSFALKALGRLDVAEAAMAKAVELAPQDWYYLSCLVSIHIQGGEVDRARGEFPTLERLCQGVLDAQPTLDRVREALRGG